MRIVAVGECMAELAPLEAPGTYRLGYAGDTLNTAWYLAASQPGWTVDYLTVLGTDAMSDAAVTFMREAGIGVDHIARDATRVIGLYLITLQDGERTFSYWRGQSAARLLAADSARLASSLADADMIYLSGITAAIVEGAGRESLMAQLRAARGNGAQIVFDPNLRPHLWPDNATMCSSIMELAAVSDIVLPSYEDEAEFFSDADPKATVARYVTAGATTVVAKNGPGDIHFVHAGLQGVVTPPKVARIVDTTAAGDSFNAGVLAGLGSGDTIEAAIARGARIAAQVIGQRGALVTIGDLSDQHHP